MLENEDLREEEQEEEAEEVVKKSKFKGGLSGEVKALVEKFEKRAKELGKNFTHFVGENGIMYVLAWEKQEDDFKPLVFPVFDMVENRKVTENDLRNNPRYIPTADVVRMQEIMTKSDEIMKEIQKSLDDEKKGEE